MTNWTWFAACSDDIRFTEGNYRAGKTTSELALICARCIVFNECAEETSADENGVFRAGKAYDQRMRARVR